jgi:hypothetical protein
MCGSNSLSTILEAHNCTFSGGSGSRAPLYAYYELHVLLVNCSITTSSASTYAIRTGAGSGTSGEGTFIHCTITTATDNYLATAGQGIKLVFAGCTYKGAAIASDDFPATTQDIDIRIYSASTVTSNVSGASWSLSHSQMSADGMIYNQVDYLKYPAYLPYGTGNTTIYTLNWTAYWRSGLATAARGPYMRNYSNGGASVAGTNAKWNFTASKWGYSVNSTVVFSGKPVNIELSVPTAGAGTGDFAAVLDISTYSDTATALRCNNFTAWADVILNGTIETNGNLTNASVVISLYNSTGFMSELANNTWNFTAGIEYNITEINGNLLVFWTANASGQYRIMLNVTNGTGFFNTTVTTEGFWIRANATVPAGAVPSPMIDIDFEPMVDIIYDQRQEIILGVVLMGMLMLAVMAYRNRKHLANRRWRMGAVEIRWGGQTKRRNG